MCVYVCVCVCVCARVCVCVSVCAPTQVHESTEVVSINRQDKTVTARDVKTGVYMSECVCVCVCVCARVYVAVVLRSWLRTHTTGAFA